MKTSETIDLFAQSFLQAQKELSNLKPEKEGYGYKYVPLSDLTNSIKPILNSHDLMFIQTVSESEKGVSIATRIIHISGQFIEDSFSLPPTTIKNVNEVQALGSSITYGRRYALSSMCGIASDEDIDGTGDTPKTPIEKKAKEIFSGEVVNESSLTHLEKIQQSTKIDSKRKSELTAMYNDKPESARQKFFDSYISKQI